MAVTSIAKAMPGFPILATGGVENAGVTLQFLQVQHGGASAVQICSAVQNQDYTVVQDYITGLKTLLFLQEVEGLEDWDGQSPPTARLYKGKPIIDVKSIVGSEKPLPNFGEFAKKKSEARAQLNKRGKLVHGTKNTNGHKDTNRREDLISLLQNKLAKYPPKVHEVIGKALEFIGPWAELNSKEHVIAMIDPEMCINCGECLIRIGF